MTLSIRNHRCGLREYQSESFPWDHCVAYCDSTLAKCFLRLRKSLRYNHANVRKCIHYVHTYIYFYYIPQHVSRIRLSIYNFSEMPRYITVPVRVVVEICMLPPCRLGISIASTSEPSVASQRLPNAAAAATTSAAAATVTKCPGSC